MTSLEDKIYSEAQNDHEYIVALRRYFHAHPELPKQEFHTAEKIEEELHKMIAKQTNPAEIALDVMKAEKERFVSIHR